MTPECLFIINGLGMGNSTRCYAVIEHLVEAGVGVHVLTSGNGLAFFQSKSEVLSLTEMKGFQYGSKSGKLSVLRTFAAAGNLYRAYKDKTRQLENILDRIRPSAVVIDSEYCVLPVLRRHIPLVGLNNSDVVVSQYLRRRNTPRDIRWQFWLIEYMDYWFHRTFCNVVLSPSIDSLPPRHNKFQRIGIIVRNSLLNTIRNTGSSDSTHNPERAPRVLFMLSGSSFSSEIDFSGRQLPCTIDVVGRTGHDSERVTFHGKLVDNIELLTRADVLVINGGFSAVSEALALKKPTLVIPVGGHAEQYLNACQVEDARRGRLVTESSVLARLAEIVYDPCRGAFDMDAVTINIGGAAQASSAISAIIERHNNNGNLAI